MATAKLKRRASQKHAIAKKQAAHTPSQQQQQRVTLAEHLHRIAILGKRIDAYIQFMMTMNEHAGLSDEIKTRAAVAFHERLVIVEQQLAHVHDAYKLE